MPPTLFPNSLLGPCIKQGLACAQQKPIVREMQDSQDHKKKKP